MTVTTLPTLNSVLLFDLIRWAEHDDAIDAARWGTWDQSSWGWVKVEDQMKEARNGACKTAYCMAGQAAHQGGYRLLFDTGDVHSVDIEMYDGHHYEGDVASASDCVQQRPTNRRDSKGVIIWEDVPGADERPVSEVGREVLGLTSDEAEVFFEGDNDLHRLRSMANRFCQDRALPLLYPYDEVWDGDYPDPDDDY